jgi:hypothetical protein
MTLVLFNQLPANRKILTSGLQRGLLGFFFGNGIEGYFHFPRAGIIDGMKGFVIKSDSDTNASTFLIRFKEANAEKKSA